MNQDVKEIPGLLDCLMQMASCQNQFAIQMTKAHRLLKEHGLLLDLKLDRKPIPLGEASGLLETLVPSVEVATPDVPQPSPMTTWNDAPETDTHGHGFMFGQGVPFSEEEGMVARPIVPTEIVEPAQPTELLDAAEETVDYVGQELTEILKHYLPGDLIEGGTGSVKLKRFRDDVTDPPLEHLLAWPTGLYHDHKTRTYQLLLNIDNHSSKDGQCIVVIPHLFRAGKVEKGEATSFITWVVKGKLRTIDDTTPHAARAVVMDHFRGLVDGCLARL